MLRRNFLVLVAISTALAFAGADAGAQGGPSTNALQGFSKNRGEPIKIDSASLEVRDKEKVATFSGDVHVVQGDTDMRCKVLVVFYEGDTAKPAMPAAQPGPSGSQQIRRMEAKGGVVVTQNEQTATGDNAEFEMRTNTVTLIGNVVVTKEQNVFRGQKLVVNLTTGVSQMDGGRVEGLFFQTPQGQGPKQKQAPKPPPRTN
jgi:lipopolysaccharide export system protein LptA